jgi:hypothetical protein
MAKRTNRAAWGLAAVLALLLMIGVGTMLYYRVSLPGVHVRVAAPGSLPVGRLTIAFFREQGFWEVSRPYDLRFCLVIVSRRYFQLEPPPELPRQIARRLGVKQLSRRPRTAPPAGPTASTRRGTGQ